MKTYTNRFDLMLKVASDVVPNKALCLDIGCGEGFFCKLLLDKGLNVVGEDLDKQCVELAWNRLKHIQSFHVVHADAQQLPFRTECFNLIICAEVIEHLLSPSLLMKDIAITLKAGGKFLLSTPNAIGIWNLVFDRLAGCIRNLVLTVSGQPKYRSGHISLFTYATLTETLRRFGFAIEGDVGRWRSEGLLIGASLQDSFLRRFGIDLRGRTLFNVLRRMELEVSRLFPKYLQSGWTLLCTKTVRTAQNFSDFKKQPFEISG